MTNSAAYDDTEVITVVKSFFVKTSGYEKYGATTLSITTFSIVTLSIMIFSITVNKM
jgi:hypothetical protein